MRDRDRDRDRDTDRERQSKRKKERERQTDKERIRVKSIMKCRISRCFQKIINQFLSQFEAKWVAGKDN